MSSATVTPVKRKKIRPRMVADLISSLSMTLGCISLFSTVAQWAERRSFIDLGDHPAILGALVAVAFSTTWAGFWANRRR